MFWSSTFTSSLHVSGLNHLLDDLRLDDLSYPPWPSIIAKDAVHLIGTTSPGWEGGSNSQVDSNFKQTRGTSISNSKMKRHIYLYRYIYIYRELPFRVGETFGTQIPSNSLVRKHQVPRSPPLLKSIPLATHRTTESTVAAASPLRRRCVAFISPVAAKINACGPEQVGEPRSRTRIPKQALDSNS